MAWLIATVVFVVPLIFFPRAAGYVLLAALALLGGWALFEAIDNVRKQAQEEKITIAASFDPTSCGAATPILAQVMNGSSRPVLSVRFDIAVKRKGYSNEIGRLSRLLDDQPMAPGAQSHYCYALPVLIPQVPPAELEFSVPLKFVTFQ